MMEQLNQLILSWNFVIKMKYLVQYSDIQNDKNYFNLNANLGHLLWDLYIFLNFNSSHWEFGWVGKCSQEVCKYGLHPIGFLDDHIEYLINDK